MVGTVAEVMRAVAGVVEGVVGVVEGGRHCRMCCRVSSIFCSRTSTRGGRGGGGEVLGESLN